MVLSKTVSTLLLSLIMVFLVLASNPEPYLVQTSESKLVKEATTTTTTTRVADGPLVYDADLKLELVYEGLEYPTNMAFLASNDILVLEKNKGTVQRIIDGQMLDQPILDIAVANENERGLLGLAISKNANNQTFVYLYFTQSGNRTDGSDHCPEIVKCGLANDSNGNKLYQYQLNDGKLMHPKLLLDLPSNPGSDHIGGAILIAPDNYRINDFTTRRNVNTPNNDVTQDDALYIVTGDNSFPWSQTANIIQGINAEGRGGILRLNQNGSPLNDKAMLGNTFPLNLYYAYGIRNSFGIDFDPITGNLWDTENGPNFGDEINLVRQGFNSGWLKVQGISSPASTSEIEGLESFGGKGEYSDPELTWSLPVGLTSIRFFDSDKFGELYRNDLFVADIHNGNIYHLELDERRLGLKLSGALADKVINTTEEGAELIFAQGFNGIVDLEVGPDGYLYILAYHEQTKADRQHYYGQGRIYRIVPTYERTN
jgi:aldose sugar dehydrogenase